MRIDLLKLAMQFSELKIKDELKELSSKYNLNIQLDKWDEYIYAMKPKQTKQMDIFA
ncbi:MAG TPA: hypothetical protein VIY47_06795 [Ignavibacteriaceae bacterium]